VAARDHEYQVLLKAEPENPDALAALERYALESQDYAALHRGYDTVLRAGGSQSLGSLAERLVSWCEHAAEGASRPRDAVELLLRASQVSNEVLGDAKRAQAALAMAWNLAPDHQILERIWGLVGQPTLTQMPDSMLVARTQLGGDSAIKALFQLAKRRLAQGDLIEAERCYRKLQQLRPRDRRCAEGMEKIAQLRKGRTAKLKSVENAVKRAGKKGPSAVKAWTSYGHGLMELGEYGRAEEALRTACEAGESAAAEQLLEQLLRSEERLDDLAQFLSQRLEQAAKGRKRGRKSRVVELRRRLYRLLHDELERTEDAKNIMNFTRAFEPTDADRIIEEARQVGSTGNWRRALEVLRGADRGASSGDAHRRLLMEEGRILDVELQDEAGAETVYGSIRNTDPDAIPVLQFYRRWYRDRGTPRDRFNNLRHLHGVLIGESNSKERVDIAVEMARLASEVLGARDLATQAWKAVLREAPDHPQAYSALREFYSTGERWHSEVNMIGRRRSICSSNSSRFIGRKTNSIWRIWSRPPTSVSRCCRPAIPVL
jgi:tetratricopeptide (TPR) repeat protein